MFRNNFFNPPDKLSELRKEKEEELKKEIPVQKKKKQHQKQVL